MPRIVSRQWIETATATQVDIEGQPVGYGYQWWVHEPFGFAMALGYGGQFVLVDPAHELVVVFTSHAEPFTAWGITNEILLRTLRSDAPLPPNPAGEQRLAAAVLRAREGPERRDVELPAAAEEVSGVTYEFRPSDLGLVTFRLTFGEDAAAFELHAEEETVTSEIGLDRRYRITHREVPVASRGSWFGDDTFVVTYQQLGLATGGELQFTFVDDRADVRLRNLIDTEKMVADRVG